VKDKQQLYEALLAEARRDPNIIGLVLFGSRGKGLETPHSDFDCCVVAKDQVSSEYQERLDTLVEHSAEFDLWTLDLSSFSKRPPLEERYDFAHVSPQIDKTHGRLQQQLLKASEQFFRSIGYGRVFDDWGGKDKWAMTWHSGH
jgi:predicted nucleotidyltransferase